jgi:hypothetical protein
MVENASGVAPRKSEPFAPRMCVSMKPRRRRGRGGRFSCLFRGRAVVEIGDGSVVEGDAGVGDQGAGDQPCLATQPSG